METIFWDDASEQWLFRNDGKVYVLPPTAVGPLAFEGVETDDRRMLEVGSMEWPDEMPMRVVMEDVGAHANAAVAATITSVERGDDGALVGTVKFDHGSEVGREAARLVALGIKKGVSIDPAAVTVEFRLDREVYERYMAEEAAFIEAMEGGEVPERPEPETSEDGSIVVGRYGGDEEVLEVVTEGVIRGATLVDIPAFRGAYVEAELVEAPNAVVASIAAAMITAGGVEFDITPTDRMVANAEQALQWVEDGAISEEQMARVPDRALEVAKLTIGDDLTVEVIAEMADAFDDVDEDWPELIGFDEGQDGFPIAERVIWDAWGGTAGQEWAAITHRAITNAVADESNPPPDNDDADDEAMTAAGAPFTAVAPHSTDTSDAEWDAEEEEVALLLDEDPAYYAQMFAWRTDNPDDDGRAKEHYRVAHHMVDSDGSVGAANNIAVRIGIAVVNGARGGLNVPEEDKAGIYAHLAKHLEDAGIEPPPAEFASSQHGREGSGQHRRMLDLDGLIQRRVRTGMGLRHEEGASRPSGSMDASRRADSRGHGDGSSLSQRGGAAGVVSGREVRSSKVLQAVPSGGGDSGAERDVVLTAVRAANSLPSGSRVHGGEHAPLDSQGGGAASADLPNVPSTSSTQVSREPGDIYVGQASGSDEWVGAGGLSEVIGRPLTDSEEAWVKSLTALDPADTFDADDCGCGITLPESRTLTAAGASERPPHTWFVDPELAGPTPVTVTDDGRVFGHLATWGVCHIGLSGGCVTAPQSEADYAYFLTGEVETNHGVIPVGNLTFGGGHADPTLAAADTVAHYDNAGMAVADVAAGEDAHGIWVAGRIRPGVEAEVIEAFRAHALSGDWRRIGGNLELVAALAVNVPGFPVPRIGLAASGKQLSLTAAIGQPQRLTPEEQVERNVERLVAEMHQRMRNSEAMRARIAKAKAVFTSAHNAEQSRRAQRAQDRIKAGLGL